MGKYFLAAKNTWNEILTYRVNFIMWRVRVILQLLATYFLWLAITQNQHIVFGYTQNMMLTYILGTTLVFSIVLATRTQNIGENINKGDLSIFLLRPINYFLYWFWVDIGDKSMNIFFTLIELTIIIALLHPLIFLQTDTFYLIVTAVSLMLAITLNFLISVLLGLIGFWSAEVWGPRFLFYTTITFFSGTLFPLDIMPKNIFAIFQLLPFTYLLFFPLKVYLGQLPPEAIFTGFTVMVFWILCTGFLVRVVWHKGLKAYTAYGR